LAVTQACYNSTARRLFPHSPLPLPSTLLFFFFNETATTEIYTLSLHDALPIWNGAADDRGGGDSRGQDAAGTGELRPDRPAEPRSEEHTSELQSLTNLVCRLLLEKKKKTLTNKTCSPLDI